MRGSKTEHFEILNHYHPHPSLPPQGGGEKWSFRMETSYQRDCDPSFRGANCLSLRKGFPFPSEKKPSLESTKKGFKKFRQRPTLPHSYPCSTIGAGGLNFCVRDGNRCYPPLSLPCQMSILLQNPPSQNREDLSKTVSGGVGIGNNPKIVS